MKGKRAATHSAALRASGEPPLQHEHFRCHKKIPSSSEGIFLFTPGDDLLSGECLWRRIKFATGERILR